MESTAKLLDLERRPLRHCALICACLALGCASGATVDAQERAQRQYELAIGLHAEGNEEGAFKTLYKALEIDPENAQAHHLLGTLFLLHRDEDPSRNDRLAEKHFGRAVQLGREADPPLTKLVADAFNGLGVLRIHQGDPAAAVPFLEQALEVDLFHPDTYMVLGNLGWAYLQLTEYSQAADALRRALKRNPGFCVGYFRLGQVMMAQKAYEGAEAELTRAIEAHEQCERFQEAWQLRGTARMSLGHREDARVDFERCVELAPDTAVGLSCRRYLEAIF